MSLARSADAHTSSVASGNNLRGNTPIFAPRHTLNIWTGCQWPQGFGLSGGVRHFGNVFADNENLFDVEGYTTSACRLVTPTGRSSTH